MRTLLLFVMLTSISFGQEGIPKGVGTGLLPPGLEGETDVQAVTKLRIEALQKIVEATQARFERGLESIDPLLGAHLELTIARIESTTVKQERLDHIEDGLKSSVLIWQYIKGMQKIGARGGDAAAEAKSLAAVFKFRLMWLNEKASNAAP